LSDHLKRESAHEETDNLSFDDNYLENTRGGISLNFQPNDIDVNILAAAATKDFGARGFYGVTPSWNAQEVLDDYLVSASASAGDEENSWRATALWRRTEDTYTLFWTLPGTYENSHETDITALNIDGRSALSENLALDWRASGTADSIDSTNLGDHSREYGSILAAPELSLGRLSLQAGINQIIDADEDSETFPVVAASYATDSGVELFSSYTETRRLPSYTELNYESPSSLGNSGLEPELSQNLEAGILVMPEDGTTLRATVFLHETKNTIDWTKTSADAARWLATDLGDVRTAGIQCDASRDWDAVSLYLAYIYLDREFDEDFYAGRYVINYPEHTGKVNVEYRPSASVALFLNHELRVQHDAAFREELDNTQVMADAGASIAIKAIEGARLNLVCENIWDDDFEIFPGQPPASTRYTVSLQWYWQ
jgi:iron complex outermembrane receptor protein